MDTEGGLYLAAEDLAKLWYLFLRGGTWEGKQVVSRDWVRASVAPAVTTGDDPYPGMYYGFKCWLSPNPKNSTRFMWMGSGFGGQFALAVPEEELILILNQ